MGVIQRSRSCGAMLHGNATPYKSIQNLYSLFFSGTLDIVFGEVDRLETE